ncbi:hypothetical protein TcCL_NonESM05965, partial [Trypanosoma cruzi]
KGRDKSHSHRTVPSSNESHAPQSKQRNAPRRAPFLTLPQSPLLLFPLLRSSQARHAHFNTRPSSTGLRIVGPSQHTQPSCAPAAPQRTPAPPSRTAPCPHNRRHAPAHNTHSATVSWRLCSTIMSNAKRVLAHVLHALQPHADQAGRHALHLVVLVVLVVGADPRSLSIHGLLLQETAERCHMYGRSNVRKQRPLTLHHASLLPSLTHTHKKTVSWGKDARSTAHTQGHM